MLPSSVQRIVDSYAFPWHPDAVEYQRRFHNSRVNDGKLHDILKPAYRFLTKYGGGSIRRCIACADICEVKLIHTYISSHGCYASGTYISGKAGPSYFWTSYSVKPSVFGSGHCAECLLAAGVPLSAFASDIR